MCLVVLFPLECVLKATHPIVRLLCPALGIFGACDVEV